MSQQLSPKVTIGTGFPPKNNVGAWEELIDVVLFNSKWAMVHFLHTVNYGGDLNLEIGIGPLGGRGEKVEVHWNLHQWFQFRGR